MPHFTTFDNFASKAIVHPQFQEGSKAIVHPQFQPEAGRAIVHPQFQPEADGFMKLDDIKGEIVLDTEPPSVTVCAKDPAGNVVFQNDALTNGIEVDWDTNDVASHSLIDDMMTGIRDTDIASESLLPGTANRALGGTAGPGGSTFSTGVDGLGEFGEEADVLTNVSYTTVRNGVWDDPTTWSGASASVISEACTPTCATGFAADALVQQGNDFAGLINPDSMRPVDFIAQANSGMSGMAQEWFSLGSAVDSLASESVLVKTYCTGYCVDGGSSEQENVFAPANMQLRSDNRF